MAREAASARWLTRGPHDEFGAEDHALGWQARSLGGTTGQQVDGGCAHFTHGQGDRRQQRTGQHGRRVIEPNEREVSGYAQPVLPDGLQRTHGRQVAGHKGGGGTPTQTEKVHYTIIAMPLLEPQETDLLVPAAQSRRREGLTVSLEAFGLDDVQGLTANVGDGLVPKVEQVLDGRVGTGLVIGQHDIYIPRPAQASGRVLQEALAP